MKMQYKSFAFDQKDMEENEDYYVVEGCFSTPDVDFGGDIVPLEAVQKSIKEHGLPVFRHQHDGSQHPLGKIVEVFYEGSKSILKAHIPKDPMFSGIIKLIKIGAYKGLSIGYMISSDKVTWKGDVRVLNEINIFEISLVDSPMNGNTDISAKRKEEEIKSMNIEEAANLSDIEAILSPKFSNKEAKTLISKITEIKQRDAEAKKQREADAKKEADEAREALRAEVKLELEAEAKAKATEVEKEVTAKKEAEAKSQQAEEAELKSLLAAIQKLK